MVGVVGLLLLFSAAIALWHAYGEAERSARAMQAQKAEALAARIEDFFANLEDQLAWTAQPGWQAAGIDRQRADFARILDQFPSVTELFSIDSGGLERLKISRFAPESVASGTDRAQEPRFAETAKAGTWFGPAYVRNGVELAATLGVAQAGGGVTVAELDLAFLSDLLKPVATGGTEAYVVGPDGRLLGHPARNPVSEAGDFSTLPHVATALAVGGAGTFTDAQIEASDETAIAAYSQLPRLGWTVFVQTPRADALSPFRLQFWLTAGLLVVGLAAAALTGLWLARQVSVPLAQLKAGAERLGEGDLSQRVTIRRRDEIGALADRFNTMASRLQQSQRGLEAKADERAHGLDVAMQQQTLTAGVLRAIGRSDQDLEAVLETLVVSAVEICEAARGSVWLMRGKSLALAAHAGYREDWLEAARSVTLEVVGDAETPLGLAAYLGQPVSVEDLPGDQRFALGTAPGYAGDRAGLAVPLQRDGAVEGVIWLSHEEAAPFSERQSGLLQGFADQALIAIENARLADGLDARDRSLREMRAEQAAIAEISRAAARSPADPQPVLETAVAAAARMLHGDCAYLCLFDGTALRLRQQHDLPLVAYHRMSTLAPTDETLAGRTFATSQATELAAVPDASSVGCAIAEAGNALAVPLTADGVSLGVVVVERRESGAFQERHVELLKALADQMVAALGAARLSSDLDTRDEELAASRNAHQQDLAASLASREEERAASLARRDFVDGLVRAIAQPWPDLPFIAHAIALRLQEQCGADSVRTFRRHGEAYRSLAEDGIEYRPGGGSVVGRVAESGRAVQVLDSWDDLDIRDKDVSIRSMLGVPLRAGGETVGVLELARGSVSPFSDDDLAVASGFSELIAIAIEKTELLEHAERRSAALADAIGQKTAAARMLGLVGRAAFDLQPVLMELAACAADVCHSEQVLILRRIDDAYHPSAASGVSDHDWDEMRHDVEDLAGGVFRQAEATGAAAQTQHRHGAEEDSDGNLTTALAVPMVWNGEVTGIVLLRRRGPAPFTAGEVEFVESLADQATIVIGRTDLEHRLVTTSHELQQALAHKHAASRVASLSSGAAADPQPVVDAVVEEALVLCGADSASLHWMREGAPELLSARGEVDHPVAAWVAGMVASQARIIHLADLAANRDSLPDTEASGALLAIPMAVDGSMVGFLLLRREAPVPFGPRQVELAETLACQAGIALESVRLSTELAVRTGELSGALDRRRAVAAVARTIGENGGRRGFAFERLLRGMAASARLLAGGDAAAIYLRGGDAFHLAVADGLKPEQLEAEQALDYPVTRDTPVGRAAFDKALFHAPDLSREEGLSAAPNGTAAALAVPMMRDGEAVGVLLVTRGTPGAFDERDVELVRTYADQAATGIDKLGLGEEVEALTASLAAAREEQQAVAAAARTIGKMAYDVGTLLQTLLNSALRLCGAGTARIYLAGQDGFTLSAALGLTPEQRAFENANPLAPERASWLGRAALDRAVVHVRGAEIEHEPDLGRFGPVGIALCAPLLLKNETIGLLALARPEPDPFAAHQVELAATLADQAVIAIESMRLLDEVQRRTDETIILADELGAARNRLSETERLAALGQFTSGIMHEIRAPLDFVREFSARSRSMIDGIRHELEHAVLEVDTRAEVEELADALSDGIRAIAEYGRRADSIIRNMLAHARDGAGEHRPVDINTMVDESLGLAYHGARAERRNFHVTLRKSLDPQAGTVDLYPQEFTRVLLNLISNGFDATAERVATANGSGYEPVLSASTRNLGDAVEIRIRDNGTGVDENVRERMFEPFFTTKPAGQATGLGLSQSLDIIVKQHAGTIEVQTEPGSFTEFRIVLPRGAASLAGRTAADGAEPLQSS